MARDHRVRKLHRLLLLAVSALLVSSISSAGFNEWTSIGPYGAGGNVRALAIDPQTPGTLYAGSDGGVFKSQDGGISWSAVNNGLTGFTVYALALDPTAPGTVYAGTNAGVFRSTNGANAWTSQRAGLGKTVVQALAIDPSNTRVLYAGTTAGGVFRSTDGATTWTASSNGLGSPDVRSLAVDPTASGTVYAGTVAGVYKSTDAGASWTGRLAANVRSLAIDPVTPSTIFAGAEGLFTNSGVFKSGDGGVTWAPMNTGLGNVPVRWVAIRRNLPGTVWVGTQGSGIFATSDGGATWRPVAGSPTTANTVLFDPSGPSVYVGAPNGFFRSPDDGANWRQENVNFATFTVNGLVIDPASPVILYAGVGRPGSSGGGVYKSVNAGVTWSPAANGLPDKTVQTLAVEPGPPTTLYAGTSGSGVYRSQDAGASWTPASSGITTNTILSLGVGGGGVVYAGTDAGVFRSGNFGSTWTAASGGLMNTNIQALAVHPSNPNAVYAGTPSGVFKTTDGGKNWTLSNQGFANIGILTLLIDPVAPATVYAGTFSSLTTGTPAGFGVYRTVDGGGSWAPANAGIESLAITALATDASGSTIYAGTPVGVYRAQRGGSVWTGVNEGLTEVVNTIAVDPTSPSTVYAGTIRDSAFKIAFGSGTAGCTSGPSTLCLNDNRFKVDVSWRAVNAGTAGLGIAVPLTTDTGAFWFFSSGNIELVLKVVDGRSFNGSFWVFYGAMSDVSYTINVTDTLTGVRKTYENPQGQLASIADTSAFRSPPGPALAPGRGSLGQSPAPVTAEAAVPLSTTAPCASDATTLCLNSNRFRVQVNWVAANVGTSGAGRAAPLASDSGSFWFFSAGNLELNLKVVDGRAVNGRFWVFFGALSDVQYTITVTDTETGQQRVYTNPQGRLASVADTSAF
ncbi:MAG: WD40/YVTN/BNR-like repeat-containing protein [Thermoanaerobaculia bacterium]